MLDQSYTGLVLSLSARIYCTASLKSDIDDRTITVRSPQFPGAEWRFSFEAGQITSLGEGENPFVREALAVLLCYLPLEDPLPGLEIVIHADNQYYSIPPSTTSRFAASEKPISETPKTGLGSSAALMTALCSSLYVLLRDLHHTEVVVEELSEEDTSRIHNIAQVAHCKAQGKVGSGFDVASAVFGSCLYSRFPPSLIESLPSPTTRDSLCDVIDAVWPMTATKVQLRRGLRLLMGDVKQGSSTPGMVKKVLGCPAALEVWPSLGISNELLSEQLTLAEPYEQSENTSIRESTRSVRGLLKQMGVEAGVEIEPDSQTKVLDESLSIDGVVSCGVPGAGGFDAIFAIVSTEPESSTELELLKVWEKYNVYPLDVTDDGAGLKIESNFSTS